MKKYKSKEIFFIYKYGYKEGKKNMSERSVIRVLKERHK